MTNQSRSFDQTPLTATVGRPSFESPGDGIAPSADDLTMILGVLSRVCAQVAALPAVPVPDWLDRAAAALRELTPSGCVAVGLVGASRGRAPLFESVGLSAAEGLDASSLRTALAGLRAMELVETSELWAGDFEFLTRVDWRGTSFGRVAGEMGIDSVMSCAVRLSPSGERPRRLVLLVGPPMKPLWDNDEISTEWLCVLKQVVRMLVPRTVLALGSSHPTKWLTDREALVLEQLTRGHSVREIAEHLDRSPHTVHDHVKALHRKLNATSRGELVAMALGHSTFSGEQADLPPNSVATEDPPRASSSVEAKPRGFTGHHG